MKSFYILGVLSKLLCDLVYLPSIVFYRLHAESLFSRYLVSRQYAINHGATGEDLEMLYLVVTSIS